MSVNSELKGISNFYKSFSGSDTLAFILMPGSKPVVLGSLTTISYSSYRNKKPVINIGRTTINGLTRGSRIFAGTLVFTLINQHWLEDLKEELDWIGEHDNIKADELPLFDIMITSANEYGNYITMYIYGLDFTDEAQTISVQDLFTENVFSFVARDLSTFKRGSVLMEQTGKGDSIFIKPNNNGQRFYMLQEDANLSLEEEREQSLIEFTTTIIPEKLFGELNRVLRYSTSRPMVGNDVSKLQEALNKIQILNKIPITGIFDSDTDNAVRLYQSYKNLPINGIVDNKLYESIILNKDGSYSTNSGLIINRNGARLYQKPSMQSGVVDFMPFNYYVEIKNFVNSTDGSSQKFYELPFGYVAMEDVYSHFYIGEENFLPTIKPNDNNPYVTMLQNALQKAFPHETINVTGKYDEDTETYVKRFQYDNGLEVTGLVDNNTWLIIQSIIKGVIINEDNLAIEFKTSPGNYSLDVGEAVKNNMFEFTASSSRNVNIKSTATCYYSDNQKQMYQKNHVSDTNIPLQVSIKNLGPVFQYNPSMGEFPHMVEYVVYPYNKSPYKWTIHLKGGDDI